MYVKQIELVNFQTIENFTQSFEGDIYLVTGENEIGKSTLLKAITILLTGQRDDVLKVGADKGYAKALIGNSGKEYEVELRFTEKNPRGTLTIKDVDAGLKSDRVTALQDIFSYTDFDAHEFSMMSTTVEGRRKQVEIVKSLIDKKVLKRLDEIDAAVKKAKDERQDVNRELKVYESQLKKAQGELTDDDLVTYKNPVDVADLTREMIEAKEFVDMANGIKQRLEDREKQLLGIPTQIADIKAENEKRKLSYESEEAAIIQETEKKLAAIRERKQALETQLVEDLTVIEAKRKEIEEKNEAARTWLKDEFEEVDLAEIQYRIDNASKHNEMHHKVKDAQIAYSDFSGAQKKANLYTDAIDKLGAEKDKLIADAKLPIDGLTFSEDGLVLNGIPFAPGKVSTSQEMEIAAKLIIAKNPKVKVFRIARGESLGSARMKSLVDFAKANGYQGFIEQVVRDQNELIVEHYNEKQ